MSLLRGVAGLISGVVIGGAGLTTASLYIPQVQEVFGGNSAEAMPQPKNAPANDPMVKTEPSEEMSMADPQMEEKPEAEQTPSDDITPEVTESVKEPAGELKSDDDTIVVTQKEAPKAGDTMAPKATDAPAPEAEPKADEAAEKPAMEPSGTDEDKLAMNTEKPSTAPETKKIVFPKIGDSNKEETDVAEEPVAQEAPVDQGITIGQKPKSSLPSIQPAQDPDTAKAEEVVDPNASNALQFNAIDYEPSDRPMMAIILHDVGDAGLSIDQMKSLNAPITIAIDPNVSDASERALQFREAGFEIIALAPESGDTAFKAAGSRSDVESNLQKIFSIIPAAVGLVDNANGTVAKSSRLAKPLVENLKLSGHGLVTLARGLNSVDREAQASGLNSGRIERVLDANRENKALISRYLDRVALDAGRDGFVIVQGTTAKETVATIASWALSPKGQSVSLAPVSAVLLAE